MGADTLQLFREKPRLTLARSRPRGARHHHFVVHDAATGASGAGGAADELLAQRKALFEWIERRAFRESDSSTSSGWAAHTSADAAERGAALELVERDALLCSWILRVSPRLLGEVHFAAYGRAFPLLQFGAGKDFLILGVVVERPNGRMLLGSACSNREEGELRLEIDAERALTLLDQGGPSAEPFASHHASFCQASAASLAWLTSGGEGLNYGELPFTYQTVRAPLWDGSDAFVSHAECTELQPLYYGETKPTYLNLRRLGSGPLNLERHPLL
jgi:hypothetical protein